MNKILILELDTYCYITNNILTNIIFRLKCNVPKYYKFKLLHFMGRPSE